MFSKWLRIKAELLVVKSWKTNSKRRGDHGDDLGDSGWSQSPSGHGYQVCFLRCIENWVSYLSLWCWDVLIMGMDIPSFEMKKTEMKNVNSHQRERTSRGGGVDQLFPGSPGRWTLATTRTRPGRQSERERRSEMLIDLAVTGSLDVYSLGEGGIWESEKELPPIGQLGPGLISQVYT